VNAPASPATPPMTSARTATVVVLAVAALVAFGFLVQTGREMGRLRPAVTNAAAPWGAVSLQLAPTREAVARILGSWDHDVDGGATRWCSRWSA
jgi:hypothetical protein